MRFRKKPVVIEAEPFNSDFAEELATWCGGSLDIGKDFDRAWVRIKIPTLEGTMTAELGDWIIRGVAGEFYACKPDIFEATYEPAEEALSEADDLREQMRAAMLGDQE